MVPPSICESTWKTPVKHLYEYVTVRQGIICTGEKRTRYSVWEVKGSCSVMSDSLQPHGPTALLRPWDFPGKNTGVGCHFLLQRIFPTQGSNLGLPHCRLMLYLLGHQRNSSSFATSLCDLEWITSPAKSSVLVCVRVGKELPDMRQNERKCY